MITRTRPNTAEKVALVWTRWRRKDERLKRAVHLGRLDEGRDLTPSCSRVSVCSSSRVFVLHVWSTGVRGSAYRACSRA